MALKRKASEINETVNKISLLTATEAFHAERTLGPALTTVLSVVRVDRFVSIDGLAVLPKKTAFA